MDCLLVRGGHLSVNFEGNCWRVSPSLNYLSLIMKRLLVCGA